MPIKRLYADAGHSLLLEQVCGKPGCKKTNVISLDQLSLGAGKESNVIALPPCACGSNEILIQTFDAAPTGLTAHRRSVNALAAHLKLKGQVTPEHLAAVTSETRTPPDMGVLLTNVAPIVGP